MYQVGFLHISAEPDAHRRRGTERLHDPEIPIAKSTVGKISKKGLETYEKNNLRPTELIVQEDACRGTTQQEPNIAE